MKIKYVEDYYNQVKERFPDLEMWEIEKILKHGFQSFFSLNGKGADIMIKSPHNGFMMYFGKLFFNKTISNKYADIKYRIKYRLKYKLKNPVWDGNYYFGLTEAEYNKYFSKKKGRLKRKIKFEKLRAYKVKEEAFLPRIQKYFFKLTSQENGKLVIQKEDFETRDVFLIAIRNAEGKIQMINE